MAQDGEAITEVFYMVAEQPSPASTTLPLAESSLRECCSEVNIMALAEGLEIPTDTFKNDATGFGWFFPDSITTAPTLSLMKWNTTTNIFDIEATLSNNDYGTNFPYQLINTSGEYFRGYKIEWNKVLFLHGTGTYKVRINVSSTLFGNTSQDSFDYCLQVFTNDRADGTVKVEYNLQNIIGSNENDKSVYDFGDLTWYNAIRLKGFFGYNTSTYEQDFTQYTNGQRVYVKDEQEPEYTLKLKPTYYAVHELMRTNVLQADEVFITDYNSKNSGSFIQKQVIKNSDYAPDWKPLQSKLAGVEVKFRQSFNNLKKLRC